MENAGVKLESDNLGCSPLALAVGDLRLRVPITECKKVLVYVVNIITRIITSPNNAKHWNLDTDDKKTAEIPTTRQKFAEKILFSLGFKQESVSKNKFSLCDDRGDPYEKIPPKVVDGLKVTLREVEVHLRSLEFPAIPSIKAVSGAIAMLKDSKGRRSSWCHCIECIVSLINRIVESKIGSAKVDEAIRTIDTSGSGTALSKRILAVDDGLAILVALGFREIPGGGALQFPLEGDRFELSARLVEFSAGLPWLQREAAMEPKHPKEDVKRAPVKVNVEKPTSESKEEPKLKRTSDVLLFEQSRRRDVERRLAEKEREAAQLKRKLDAKQAAEDATMTVRDTVTMLRMAPRERETVGRMARALGVTSSVLDTSNKQEITRNSEPTRLSHLTKAQTTSVKTRLVESTKAGCTALPVESNAGFIVGFKVRVGTGFQAEESFLIGFGSLVLLEPLQRDHSSGEVVVMVRPGKSESRRFSKWQLGDFLERAVLSPIIAVAVSEGERILEARRVQENYSKRAVPKSIFRIKASTVTTISSKQDEVFSNLASLPWSGSVVIPRRNSLLKIDITISMAKLRRFFDSILDALASHQADNVPCLPLKLIRRGFVDIRGHKLFDGDITSRVESLIDDLLTYCQSSEIKWAHFYQYFRPDLSVQETTQSELSMLELSDQDCMDIKAVFTSQAQIENVSSINGVGCISLSGALKCCQELDGVYLSSSTIKDYLASTGCATYEMSLIQFAQFRQHQNPHGGCGSGGWFTWARRGLLACFKSAVGEQAVFDPFETDCVELSVVISKMKQNPDLEPFLNRPLSSGNTLIDQLKMYQTQSSHVLVSWNSLENLLYEHIDEIPILMNTQTRLLQNGEKNVVYETAVDTVNHRLFVLLDDGVLQEWDSANRLSYAEQVLFPEYPPSSSVESASAHAEWRIKFGLDRDLSLNTPHAEKHERFKALRLSKTASRRMLNLSPRLDVLALDSASGVLALNTTAGDLCVRFHNATTMRRLCRVRLALSPLRHFDPCLFQQFPESLGDASETTEGAVQKFNVLSSCEVIVATISGSDKGYVFCMNTGVKLAQLAGHRSTLSAILWNDISEYVLTGCADGTIRCWDIGEELLPAVNQATSHHRAAATSLTEAKLVAAETVPNLNDDLFGRLRVAIHEGLVLLGMHPSWRMGAISSLVSTGSEAMPLVEVTFDDGSVHLGVNHHLLRYPNEALSDWSNAGPKFENPPISPQVGASVAVWFTDMGATIRKLFDRFDTRGAQELDSDSLRLALFNLSSLLAERVGEAPQLVEVYGEKLEVPGRSNSWKHLGKQDVDVLVRYLCSSGHVSCCDFERFVCGLEARQKDVNDSWIAWTIPSKWVLAGHKSEITSIAFLPVSSLIASSSRDGTLRLWDPTSHAHRLTHPSDRCHVKTHPGYYKPKSEEWTASGRPYVCVASCTLEATLADVLGDENGTCVAVSLASAVTSVSPLTSVMVSASARAEAKLIDQMHGSDDACRGFLYVCSNGDLLMLSAQSFHADFIHLADLAPLESKCNDNDVLSVRAIFRRKSDIIRVIYAVSTHHQTLDKLRDSLMAHIGDNMDDLNASTKANIVIFGRVCDAKRCLVFREPLDSSEESRDRERFVNGLITKVNEDQTANVALDNISLVCRVPFSRLLLDEGSERSNPVAGSSCRLRTSVSSKKSIRSSQDDLLDCVEALHVKVIDSTGSCHVATFNVSRLSVLVPACDFDVAVPQMVESAAYDFINTQVQQAFAKLNTVLPARIRYLAVKAQEEEALLEKVSDQLREVLLLRHDHTRDSKEEDAKKMVHQAFQTCLQLPSLLTSVKTLFTCAVSQLKLLFSCMQRLSSHDRISVHDLLVAVEVLAGTSPIASHVLQDCVQSILKEDLHRVARRQHDTLSLADFEDMCLVKALQCVPSEFLYKVLAHCQMLSPSDCSMEEFHAYMFNVLSQYGDSWMFIDAKMFKQIVAAMDPIEHILSHIQTSEQHLPQGFVDRLIVDKGAQENVSDVRTSFSDESCTSSLSFLQRYALMVEADSWMQQANALWAKLESASSPALEQGIHHLVSPVLRALPRDTLMKIEVTPPLDAIGFKLFTFGDECKSGHPLSSSECIRAHHGWAEGLDDCRHPIHVLEMSLTHNGDAIHESWRRMNERISVLRGLTNNGLVTVLAEASHTACEASGDMWFPDGSVKRSGVTITKEELVRSGSIPMRFIAVEQLRGWKTLRAMVAEKGCLANSPRELNILRSWGQQLVQAVNYCHEHGVVLGNISADTVVMSPDGTSLKICSFSNLCSDRNEERSADTWGIGLVFLELLGGSLPKRRIDKCFDFMSVFKTVDDMGGSGVLRLSLPNEQDGPFKPRISTAAILHAMNEMRLSSLLPVRAHTYQTHESGVRELERLWCMQNDMQSSWCDVLHKISVHLESLNRKVHTSQDASEYVMSQLRNRDGRATGVLSSDQFVSCFLNELSFPLSTEECATLMHCIQCKVSGNIKYAQLEPLLHINLNVPAPVWTVLDILGLCFAPNPSTRPLPSVLASHPFFAVSLDEESDIRDTVRSFTLSPPLLQPWVNQHLKQPIEQLLIALQGNQNRFDLGELGEVIRTVHELTSSVAPNVQGFDSSWLCCNLHLVVDELMRQEILEGLATVATRLLRSETTVSSISRKVKVSSTAQFQVYHRSMNVPPVFVEVIGFIEGDRKQTPAVRVLKRLEILAKNICENLTENNAALSKHIGSVLRFVTMLLTGSVEPLPLMFNAESDTTHNLDTHVKWRPALASLFKPLLIDLVGEDGGGNYTYPIVKSYIRWCELVATNEINVEFDPSAGCYVCVAGSYATREDMSLPNHHVGCPFIRSSSYYSTLLAVIPQLDLLSKFETASYQFKARAANMNMFAKMCHYDDLSIDSNMDGLLDHAILMMDVGFAEMCLVSACDSSAQVRSGALRAARNAVVSGLSGMSSKAQNDLALKFCSAEWISEFARILRMSSAHDESKAFQDMRYSIEALCSMVTVAGHVLRSWFACEVSTALGVGLLAEVSSSDRPRQDTHIHKATFKPFTVSSKEASLGPQPQLDVKGVIEALGLSDMKMLHAVAAGSVSIKKLLIAGIFSGEPNETSLFSMLESNCSRLSDRGVSLAMQLSMCVLNEDTDVINKFSAECLNKACDEWWQIHALVSRFRIFASSTLFYSDGTLMTKNDSTRRLREMISLLWGWCLTALGTLQKGELAKIRPLVTALRSTAQEGISLFDRMVTDGSDMAQQLLDVIPHASTIPDNANETTALCSYATFVGAEPRFFDAGIPNPIWTLLPSLYLAIQRGIGLEDVDGVISLPLHITESGIGFRIADAIKNHGNLVRVCSSKNCVSAHLCDVYVPLRRSLKRLWVTALRRTRQDVQMLEQLLVGNVIEYLVSDWLADETILDISGVGKNRKFVSFHGTMPLRDEAIDMLASLIYRGGVNASLSSELVRQCRRHNLPGYELGRLKRWGLSAKHRVQSVIKMLSLLIAVNSPSLDVSIQSDALVPSALISAVRQASFMGSTPVQQMWMEYCELQCGERSHVPPLDIGEHYPMADRGLRLVLEMSNESVPDEPPPPYSEPMDTIEEAQLTVVIKVVEGASQDESRLCEALSDMLSTPRTYFTVLSFKNGRIELLLPISLVDVLWDMAQQGLVSQCLNSQGFDLLSVQVEGRGMVESSQLPMESSSPLYITSPKTMPPSPDHGAGPPSPPKPTRVRWNQRDQSVDLATITTRLGGYVTELRTVYNNMKNAQGLDPSAALTALLQLGVGEESAQLKMTDYWNGSDLSFAEFIMLYASATGLNEAGDGRFFKQVNSNGVHWCHMSPSDAQILEKAYQSIISRALSDGSTLDDSLLSEALSLVLGERIRGLDSWIVHRGELDWTFGEFCEAYTNLGGVFSVVLRSPTNTLHHDDVEQLRDVFNRMESGGRISSASLKMKGGIKDSGQEVYFLRSWIRERDRTGKGFVDFDDMLAFHRQTGRGCDIPPWIESSLETGVESVVESPNNQYKSAALKEVSIRKAFDNYDLNGDGLITYLELRTVFARANKQVSDFELREWIRTRDRSNNGGVSFSDFRAAYLEREAR